MNPAMERRRVQRITVDGAIQGTMMGLPASAIDLSALGLQLEHEFPLAVGRKVRFDFLYEGEKFSVDCEVVRCKMQKSAKDPKKIVYHSGLIYGENCDAVKFSIRRVLASIMFRTPQMSYAV